MTASRDHDQPTTSGKGTLTLAALSAALLVSGCGSRMAIVAKAEDYAVMRDTNTGCLWVYPLKGEPHPMRNLDGSHAGCTRGSVAGVPAQVADDAPGRTPK